MTYQHDIIGQIYLFDFFIQRNICPSTQKYLKKAYPHKVKAAFLTDPVAKT